MHPLPERTEDCAIPIISTYTHTHTHTHTHTLNLVLFDSPPPYIQNNNNPNTNCIDIAKRISAGSNLGHVVVLAQPRQVRVQLLDALLVRLEQLGPDAPGLGQLF